MTPGSDPSGHAGPEVDPLPLPALDPAQLGLGDMDAAAFRRHGHAVVEQVARYLETVGERPPLPAIEPGAIAAALPAHPPTAPEPLAAILADVDRILLPGLTHWTHPRFFAYFSSSASGPAILGEWLAAAFNSNAMLWRTAPAATELERVATAWLAELMGLPSSWVGHINDTASVSTLVALGAAREAAGLAIRDEGLAGRPELPRLRVYGSTETHSSVEKAVVTLGLGRRGYRALAADADLRLDPRSLADAIAEDRRLGWRPLAVVATVGTTSTASVDPVAELAEVCAEAQVWLHVDAAYGGALAIVPEQRGLLRGAERADSLVVNPHKGLFVPLDCSVLYLRDPGRLRQAFSLVPAYLRSEGQQARATSAPGVGDLMDTGIALGRRFRSLKLWMTLRYFGADGLAARIRDHLELAGRVAAFADARPDWERMAPSPLAVVCLRHHPPGWDAEDRLERHNRALLTRLDAGGVVFCSHTEVRGCFTLRVAVGQLRTTPADVDLLLGELERAAAEVAAAG
ncbi:MAG TPA: pyridoxal-dependent decarboxylase [Verrucomicrobiae bacterium]|nr:pyridoxal-dependent decarboxylase [Verrucomicrobiae bacterium]